MSKNHQKTIYAYLDGTKLKRTRGRIAVLSILLNACGPLTIEAIQERLKEKVHTVTLYRMLRQFVKAGIVYQTDFRTGRAYYELQQEHHHHIVCTTCGLQEEVKACGAKLQASAQKESQHFQKVDTHSLEFFGVCNNCTK